MGMDTHVVGFREPDEKWNQMVAAFESCKLAGVEPPPELWEFFGGESPRGKEGCEIDIDDAVREYSSDSEHGYSIDINKLPKDVSVVRVYNSW